MRIVSILTALIVCVVLYLFIFERDRLTEGDMPEQEMAQTETREADDFAPPAQKAETETTVVSVVTTLSTARALDSAVLLRGETEAARQVTVTAETAGRVISTPLRKGAVVAAGDVLCELDPGTREATRAQARAALAEAEVALANAQKLASGGYASETQVLSAEAGIESARAALAQIDRDIENLTIKAPFSGLLESDSAELGTYLTGGASCATVIQLDPIKLVAYAPEAEVNKITVGAPAGGRLISGQEVMGQVSFLSRSADTTTRTFRVEVEIPNADAAIRDGQTVEMAISAAGQPAHLVPQSALTLDDEGEIGLRLVGDDNRVVFAPVQVLRDTREGIWVSGLDETVQIITVGQEFVRAGVMVDPHPAATEMESGQ